MPTLSRDELRYFTGCALTGLLQNPQFTSINGQKYLQMKKLTVEGLAVQSALETMEILSRMEEELNKAEASVSGTVTSIKE